MILHMLRTQIAANSIPIYRPPYIWERARSREFFNLVKAHFTDQLWVENFRLTRSGFKELCQLIGPASVCCRKLVPTDERIAIALYKLATCAEYRVVGETFGVSKTTVHRCVYAVCFAIREQAKQHIKLPDLGEAQEIADRNNRAYHVPQVFGWNSRSHTSPSSSLSGFCQS